MAGVGTVRNVSREELEAALADGSATIVDVREPHEFEAGHVPGSVSMPLSAFDPSRLPPSGWIVFSCAAGVRSLRAVELSRAFGLPYDEHYPGGFKDWAASGAPVASGADS